MRDGGRLNFSRLEATFRSLASTNRLRLLELLSEPRQLEEILLPPSPPQAGRRPGRPISRPAVIRHLRQLADQGIVKVRKVKSGGKAPSNEYVADRSRLFALLEDLRELARLGSATPFEAMATAAADPPRPAEWPAGPKLVLIRGAYEGTVYPLSPRRGQRVVRWRVGRRPKSHVCLDYDPYASMDHCEIQSDDGILRIVSLPGAKNGTWLNWREMPQARPQDLRPGDVVRVGQSVLVFQDR